MTVKAEPRQLITDLTRHWALVHPDKPAVIEVGEHGTVRQLTYAQLAEQADAWAAWLVNAGVKPGEPVAYQLPNVRQFVALSLGTMQTGAVCEPLMPIFRERELEFMLAASQARVLVVPERFRGHDHGASARGIQGRLHSLRSVLSIGLEDPLLAAVRPPATVAVTPDMTVQLLFTSGSTGEPKGVLHNHVSLNTAAQIHIRHFGLTVDDVIYVPSPLAHQTGFLYGMWIAVTLGATEVIQTSWDADIAFDAVNAHGVTFVQAATPFLADLVRVARQRGRRADPLRIFVATGAAVPRELARDASELLGAEVGGAFGTTESCLGAAFVPGAGDPRAWLTDGRVLEGIKLRVTDDDSNVLEANREGNFEVLTPTLFEGYLDRPELTAAAMTADGYYRTGDLARIDADGYVKITGRVKDVINRGGEKVPVVEVEQVLYAHPAIREVAIVAMPDARLGERACAFVVLEPGASLDLAALQQHLDFNRVAKPYWPERLQLVSALPHTPSGKIQKFLLRERISDLMEREASPQ
ncbi:MAG: AMP-binding protein [Solirubrobacteraceae bacterium]